jgi:hypothetical protein
LEVKQYLWYLLMLWVFIMPISVANAQNDTTLIISDSIKLITDSTQMRVDSLAFSQPEQKIPVDIDSISVIYFKGSINNLKEDNFQSIDTSTLYFQQFDPVKKYDELYSTLSNIGLAHTNMVFSPSPSIDYYFTNKSFKKYIYENDQVKYFKLYQPYTELGYFLGSKKEQNFKVVFNRELIKRLTVGIDLALNNSPGPYANSKADDKRVFITGQYYTKNMRYGLIGNYLYNKLIVQENGGIIYDSIFEQNLEKDRRQIPVFLNNAQNLVKQSGFFVEQYFNLLKSKPNSGKRKIDAGSVSWSFQYQRNQMIYTDNDTVSNFYKPFDTPLNNDMTYDSIYQMRIRNTLQWSSIGYYDDPLSKVFNIYFGASYDYNYQAFPDYSENNSFIYNQLTNFSYHQIKPYGGIGLNIKKSFRLTGFATINFGGYNSGDLRIKGQIDQYFGNVDKNFGKIKAGVEFVNKTPDWYFQQFQSNFYRWNNNFKKETILLIYGEYQYQLLKGGVKFYTIGNYTYFNDSVRPAQYTNSSTLLQIYIEGTAMVKKFGINTRLVYQKTSNPDIIRVPDFSGVADIFFKSVVFKRAATLQVGFELRYFTAYYANAYMPAIRDWYIQNEQKIGNYLYADVYLTLKVKRARLFFKYAHFNQLFSQNKYYLAPGYPARDARFYLGVSWRFYK